MNLVESGQAFSFNYTAYDQDSGLFVAFNVYDITTGTAVFVEQLISTYVGFGVYSTTYIPASQKTYLIIGVVYTDSSYTTADTTRVPTADLFQSIQANLNYFGAVYVAYDLSTSLSVRGKIYNMSSGTPVFVQNVSMPSVAFGVYFGSFTGTVGLTYQAASIVYTDNTFTTVDLNYAPACDSFDAVVLASSIQIGGSANLLAPALSAVLVS